MNISLITTSRVTLGVRLLSAILKQEKGIAPKCLFMGITGLYSDKTLDELYEIIKNDDMIGVSVIENTFSNTIKTIEYIRSKGYEGLIVMGGQYAIMCPEECIKYSDVVCIGDGEKVICNLVDALSSGKDFSALKNTWTKKAHGEIIKNPLELIQDLDELPYLDYFDGKNHYKIKHFGGIEKVAGPDDYKYPNEGNIISVFSRGCVYDCTYCCSSKLRQIYGKYRQNSIERVLDELEHAVSLMKGENNRISIMDDDFFLRSEEEIKYFSVEYKKRINQPFLCHARLSGITEEKLSYLLDAGLYYLYTGIQSASLKASKDLYGRDDMPSYGRGIDIFFKLVNEKSLLGKVTLAIDFIILNPFIKKEDMIYNIKYALDIWDKHRSEFFVYSRPYRLFRNTTMYTNLKDNGYASYVKEYQDKMDSFCGFGYLLVNMKYSQHVYLDGLFLLLGGPQKAFKAGAIPRKALNWLIKDTILSKVEKYLLPNKTCSAIFRMVLFLSIKGNLVLLLRRGAYKTVMGCKAIAKQLKRLISNDNA